MSTSFSTPSSQVEWRWEWKVIGGHTSTDDPLSWISDNQWCGGNFPYKMMTLRSGKPAVFFLLLVNVWFFDKKILCVLDVYHLKSGKMDFVTSGCLHFVGESLSIESGEGASHCSTCSREGFGVYSVGEIRGRTKVIGTISRNHLKMRFLQIGTISKFIVSCNKNEMRMDHLDLGFCPTWVG